MVKELLTETIRDTNDYSSDGAPLNEDRATIQIVNDLDAEVTYTIEGTYDDDTSWEDAITIQSTTLGSNTNASVSITQPWDKIRVTVTASTEPTSGEITIKAHTS